MKKTFSVWLASFARGLPMFMEFFYALRSHKVPVSTSEYLDLLEVLEKRLQMNKPFKAEDFYSLARNCLVKDIKHYDAYDLTFSKVFEGLEIGDDAFRKKLESWLENPIQKELSEERLKNAQNILSEDLLNQLKKRLDEQKERHDGGNHWIGTGGTSAFGHSGYNPAGVRVGGGSRNRSAQVVAGLRRFRNYRADEILQVRQLKIALKSLRELRKTGPRELNIEQTIRKTCDLGGEIELVYGKSRKNKLKLLLIMDVGGSMDPHAQRVSRLFSAGNQVNHFKEFGFYYFHNIFYDKFYLSADLDYGDSMPFEKLHRKYGPDTRVILVGDAYMAPYELMYLSGLERDFYTFLHREAKGSSKTGIDRVMELKRQFPHTIWLNPEPVTLWQAPTIRAISEVVPMFELSIEGLQRGIRKLMGN